jgi:predicted nuclease with TOPRIM domain
LLCAGGAGKEIGMDAESQEGSKRKYSTPSRVQAWFLGRSRDGWKAKYKELKVQAKRLQNRVNDVTHSREMWRERTAELEKENAALREQAALKKSGRRDGVPV